jgi:hypothetical protein
MLLLLLKMLHLLGLLHLRGLGLLLQSELFLECLSWSAHLKRKT